MSIIIKFTIISFNKQEQIMDHTHLLFAFFIDIISSKAISKEKHNKKK